MNTIYRIYMYFFAACTLLTITACEEEELGNEEALFTPYVLSLGINSNGTTTYYMVTTSELMSGTTNAVGKGVKQSGYRDYERGEQTMFNIGGLGLANATGIVRDAAGYLAGRGDSVFNNSLSVFTQMDGQTMIGLELPANKESGDKMTLYTVSINDASITSQVRTPISPLSQLEWSGTTGMCYSEDNVYVTYPPMDPTNFETLYTDTTFVMIHFYPGMRLKTLMKNTRASSAGLWSAFNGIFKVESGDMYVMSNSAIANGFSQGTKNAALLRIPKGETRFDDYCFSFETVSGGLKPAHIKYIGNGLVFTEVDTISPQTSADHWGDKSLKCCIIDLNNKAVCGIKEIPAYNGDDGRRFAALMDGDYVCRPVAVSESTYVYQVDPQTAATVRGTKVSTTFINRFSRLD